jgi:hypothetical protein
MAKNLHRHHEDHGHHSIMEIFETLSFREKWRKVFYGLSRPKKSGDYKYAKLELQRLAAPLAAIAVPVLALCILTTLVVTTPSTREIEIQIIDPTSLDELEEFEDILDKIEPPEEIEIITPNDSQFSEVVSDLPQVAPQVMSGVALTKSPLVMKGMQVGGLLGGRDEKSRKKAIVDHGGTSRTEDSVLMALRWLKVHQAGDGSWTGDGEAHAAPMTAFALLTFLANGATPTSSEEFGETIQRAIEFLLNDQQQDGLFKSRDSRNYAHPIATYALSEAFALTSVPMVKAAAENAAALLVERQHESGGWDYNMGSKTIDPETGLPRDDTSYMAWCAQALKAAKMARLNVPGLDRAMKRAILGFKKNASPAGGFGYTTPQANGALTGAGVLCMQLLGAAKDPDTKRGLQVLESRTCKWDNSSGDKPLYYWYYETQAKFHRGQAIWTRWNREFAPTLAANQNVESGQYTWKGEPYKIGHWGSPGKDENYGRVYSTSLCALMLQVYYRYLPTYKAPAEIPLENLTLGEEAEEIDIEIL